MTAKKERALRGWATPRPDGQLLASLDRGADDRNRPGLLRELLADPRARVLDTAGGTVPVLVADGAATLALRPPRTEAPRGDDPAKVAFLGRDDTGTAYLLARHRSAADADRAAGEPRSLWLDLRECGPWLGALELELALTGVGLARWHATHTHCPQCGAPAVSGQAGWVRVCGRDGSIHFPRTDPAVIMSVIGPDDRLLLARGARFKAGRVSVLAGFVEPGERLEDAVAREVSEEVGLRVDSMTYVGSQPWPFPASVMIGYEARTREARLRVDETEIVEARWWARGELAAELAAGTLGIAGRLSIARRLIERWYGGRLDQALEAGWVRRD